MADWLKPNSFGFRHITGILLFFCMVTTFFIRLNLSIAIVSMMDKNSSNPDFHEFDWTETQKSAILSSFFWGYLVMQGPAGELGQNFSPKMLLLIANLLSSLLAGVTPIAAFVGGWKLVCAIRVCEGLAQGFVFPLSYTLLAKWAPPSERNRLVGFTFNGSTLGGMIAMPISGLLASSAGGWPSIFYFSCLLGVTWSALWAWFGSDSPAEHTSISEQERNYIQNSLIHTTHIKKFKTPWKAIFTSVPFWALVMAHMGNGWTISMITSEMPSYINSVLRFNIGTNGMLSTLPYLSMWCLTFPVCWLADYLKKKGISDNVTRKLWTTIAMTGSALMMLAMGFVRHDAVLAVIFITIALSLEAFHFTGYNINHLDLAPNFAGVLIGLSCGLENITAILAPLTVGWVVTDPSSAEDWRIAFIISTCVTIVGNIFFLAFGSTDVQPWNSVVDDKPEIVKQTDNEV